HNTFLEYCDAFAETEFEEVILLCQSTTGAFGVYTNRAINTVADLSGLQCRVTANYIPFFEKLNISGIMMPSAEVYEGIRLGVIDSNLTNISSCTAFKLHEVTNYFTGLPMTFGEMVIVMSRQTYNALPQDLQAVIDETKAFICETWLNYLLTVESTAKTVVAGENPDFKWVDLPASELAKISELTIPMLQEKAAAMDAAGLDGSGAMAWLLAHSV
ncbi:MAG: TRAP transporter substrate-binding protein DctP, partial [Oscillospiraceae bacterium]|nr:TRAP transporter substrate-binding protein DctP [Oscillospiraceae bacterium]